MPLLVLQYGSRTKVVQDQAIPCESVAIVTQTVAVTGDNKELWPHSKSDSSSNENAGSNKVVLWLINCTIFNSFLVYKHLNRDSKLKYKAFVMNVAKIWATD
jgi:hypothetical protein